MRVLTWDGLTPPPASLQRHIVAVGNFDGVHRGHAALLDHVIALKTQKRRTALIITFDPPPNALLRPETIAEPLTTMPERLRLIAGHSGIDTVLILQTTPQLLELTAPVFWDQLLCQLLQIQGMVEGKNFCFGKNRAGNVSLLSMWAKAKGIPFEVVEDVFHHGMQISSTMIRLALKRGDMQAANDGLGRYYALTGTVVQGEQRGQKIGFPTCNLGNIATMIPQDGVYAGTVKVNDRVLPAAVNIGPNPTFGQSVRKVEAHLIDYHGDLYGRTLRLELIARLRDTVRFESLGKLQEQLRHDVELAKEIGLYAIGKENNA